MWLPIYLVALVLLPVTILGLNEDKVKELTCKQLEATMDKEPIDLDMKWLESVSNDKWYVPIWSKLHAYRIASDMLDQDIPDITEDRLGSSCILFKKDSMISAYGKEVQFEMESDGSSLTFKAPRKGTKSGKFSFKLTDNKSYIFGINCWEDGQASWAVISTTPTLRSGVKDLVLDYVKVLGLKKSMAQEEDYGSCEGTHLKKEL